MIGAMFIGTLVSLFIIPLIYWFIYRDKKLDIMKKFGLIILLGLSQALPSVAQQQQVTLDLQQTIKMANDSSLEAFRTKICIFQAIGNIVPIRQIACRA